MIITIDGPVGTGKSTIARLLAARLGFIHFDTGAMYRCLTYGLIKHRIDLQNPSQLASFLHSFTFTITVANGEKHYIFEEEDITTKIRQQEVASQVSPISAIPAVRAKLVHLQQQMGHQSDAVFEGRDMGTVVFPDATLKIYLTARPEVRAQRRYEELRLKFPEEADQLSFEGVLEQLQERDERDTTRTHSPLRPAKDAHVIDTSAMTIEEVLSAILTLVIKK